MYVFVEYVQWYQDCYYCLILVLNVVGYSVYSYDLCGYGVLLGEVSMVDVFVQVDDYFVVCVVLWECCLDLLFYFFVYSVGVLFMVGSVMVDLQGISGVILLSLMFQVG